MKTTARTLRCCMCPQINSDSAVCPGMPGTVHPEDTMCDFAVTWIDAEGKRYKVVRHAAHRYKAAYRRPWETQWHLLRMIPFHDSFDEAQRILNRHAMFCGWRVSQLPQMRITLKKEYGAE